MARRRRRFFRIVFLFWRFFTCFHGNSAYLRPCYHALRQPVGAADRGEAGEPSDGGRSCIGASAAGGGGAAASIAAGRWGPTIVD